MALMQFYQESAIHSFSLQRNVSAIPTISSTYAPVVSQRHTNIIQTSSSQQQSTDIVDYHKDITDNTQGVISSSQQDCPPFSPSASASASRYAPQWKTVASRSLSTVNINHRPPDEIQTGKESLQSVHPQEDMAFCYHALDLDTQVEILSQRMIPSVEPSGGNIFEQPSKHITESALSHDDDALRQHSEATAATDQPTAPGRLSSIAICGPPANTTLYDYLHGMKLYADMAALAAPVTDHVAVRAFDTFATTYPILDQQALIGAAKIYARHGYFAAAVSCLRNSVSVDPRHAPTLMAFGDLFLRLEHGLDAERLFRQAIKYGTPSDQSDAYCGLGRSLEVQDRSDAAKDAYEAALRHDPSNLRAFTLLDALLKKPSDSRSASIFHRTLLLIGACGLATAAIIYFVVL
eukprot:m.122880 g.122880  ORF g.122880 m.122880 type:complete len:407 (+) comp15556_c1_seq1:732-1952(+)